MIDDATSALDSLTEAKVRSELAAYPGTKIIITQRCVAAMSADKILVLENGSLVGLGSHAELMESCDMYMEIWQSQVSGKGVSS
jgi:ATP-binding cassette subfamily B protein